MFYYDKTGSRKEGLPECYVERFENNVKNPPEERINAISKFLTGKFPIGVTILGWIAVLGFLYLTYYLWKKNNDRIKNNVGANNYYKSTEY